MLERSVSTYGARFLLTCLIFGAPAFAQPQEGNFCVDDFQSGAVCTANDVRLEALTPITIVEDCTSGTPGEIEVIFEALVSADGSPDRYDIGIFIAKETTPNVTDPVFAARDGDNCFHDYLDPPVTTTPTYGDSNMDGIDDIKRPPATNAWWDGDSDSCGDMESNTQVVKTLIQFRLKCEDSDGDGEADIGVCTSWDNNANTTCSSVSGAFPGTKSKCSCQRLDLGTPVPVTLTGFTIK